MDIEQKLVNAVIEELRPNCDDLEGIYLFGSRATKEAMSNSDWDFAFLSRSGLDEEQQWKIISDLEMKYDVTIDVVSLYQASTVLQIQVLKTGRSVWIGNQHKLAQFEYLALSYYQKLNEERAEILKDIKQRGTIYG